MSRDVYRFIVPVCPAPQHPEYYGWQTALVCIFVGDDDRERAYSTARDEIRNRHWLPIGPFRKETLIKTRVDEAEEVIRTAYAEAQGGKVIFNSWLDQMPITTKKKGRVFRAPRIGELFIDQVIATAGGRRLTTTETNNDRERNADYLIEDSIIELKDLQEEGLLVPTRQAKLAQLLRGLASGDDYARLSPNDLSAEQWRDYVDIVGRPIQNQIKSAAQQLKTSRARVNSNRGGVIFLNTGYTSLPHELFDAIVRRYCQKDTRQVDFAICISSWLLTNGFDSAIFFALTPREGGGDIVSAVRTGFWKEIAKLMTDWTRTGFAQNERMLPPVQPIAFDAEKVNFSTQPEMLPSDLDREWNKGDD